MQQVWACYNSCPGAIFYLLVSSQAGHGFCSHPLHLLILSQPHLPTTHHNWTQVVMSAWSYTMGMGIHNGVMAMFGSPNNRATIDSYKASWSKASSTVGSFVEETLKQTVNKVFTNK